MQHKPRRSTRCGALARPGAGKRAAESAHAGRSRAFAPWPAVRQYRNGAAEQGTRCERAAHARTCSSICCIAAAVSAPICRTSAMLPKRRCRRSAYSCSSSASCTGPSVAGRRRGPVRCAAVRASKYPLRAHVSASCGSSSSSSSALWWRSISAVARRCSLIARASACSRAPADDNADRCCARRSVLCKTVRHCGGADERNTGACPREWTRSGRGRDTAAATNILLRAVHRACGTDEGRVVLERLRARLRLQSSLRAGTVLAGEPA